ncbi:hypothetical protein J416_14867 [Gracilibacillus halophilus YIM-C55.5]|uniref:Uncharacterized protein n=1 Tax=Gracilibacillus halophilus YIM-C55.5 TaxID=1308866 RepID=N4W8W9_9BACI|nr:hypothetical protein [Gracilibacillus halophilus]ENH95674.1 hypothetical protein J416_14867 [Gracilibacillus halophilus YIM-C55.5]
MPDFTLFIAILIMTAIQYFMATRSSPLWGIIMPLGFVAVMTWMIITNQIDSTVKYTILLIVGLLLLIEEWVRGRKSLNNKRQIEMNKMKSHDLK